MYKIIILFLFTISFSFAQDRKKDEVVQKVTKNTCECVSKGEIKKDNVKIGYHIYENMEIYHIFINFYSIC